MAAVGKGRAWGRGRGSIDGRALGEPLRQPGSVIFPAFNREGKGGISNLVHHLHNLRLSDDGSLSGLSDIKNVMQSASHNEEEFTKAINTIHMYSLESKVNARIGALVCKEFSDTECNGIKFKSLLLDLLYQNFQDREIIRADTEKFVNCATFLCEVFHNVRLQNSAMINFLPGPVYIYLELLLDDGSDMSVEAFSEQMKKNGQELEGWNSNTMQELLIKVRKKIISSSCSVKSRSLLLHILETALVSWNPLPSSLKTMYENFSKPIFTLDK